MLVLSRRVEEAVIVRVGCEVIEVKVLQIRGDKVRLGFVASQHVKVNRSEIDREIMNENRQEAS